MLLRRYCGATAVLLRPLSLTREVDVVELVDFGIEFRRFGRHRHVRIIVELEGFQFRQIMNRLGQSVKTVVVQNQPEGNCQLVHQTYSERDSDTNQPSQRRKRAKFGKCSLLNIYH